MVVGGLGFKPGPEIGFALLVSEFVFKAVSVNFLPEAVNEVSEPLGVRVLGLVIVIMVSWSSSVTGFGSDKRLDLSKHSWLGWLERPDPVAELGIFWLSMLVFVAVLDFVLEHKVASPDWILLLFFFFVEPM